MSFVVLLVKCEQNYTRMSIDVGAEVEFPSLSITLTRVLFVACVILDHCHALSM